MTSDSLFDLARVPFSRHGSYLAISRLPAHNERPAGLYLRFIRGSQPTVLLRLEPCWQGQPAACQEAASPESLSLVHPAGQLEFCLTPDNRLRIRGRGLGIRLLHDFGPHKFAVPAPDGKWRLYCGTVKLMLESLCGKLKVDAPWEPVRLGNSPHQRSRYLDIHCQPDSEAGCEMILSYHEGEYVPPKERTTFEQAVETNRREFAQWLGNTAAVPDQYAEARRLAAYVTWSACVPAQGNFDHPAMLMSKNHMVKVWNWDNCFNAWASMHRDPTAAWRQFMLHLRWQNPFGALGDGITENEIEWQHTKPPVHGWILSKLRQIGSGIERRKLAEVYPLLIRWTRWWQRCRDDDGDGLVQCLHGNDTGWDNATLFDVGMPVESPDLNALLILQMEELAELAQILGKPAAAKQWRREARRLLHRLLDHSWNGRQFLAPVSGSHRTAAQGDCLLARIPIVLGQRLPREVRERLLQDLREPGRFLVEHGLTTESRRSPLFLENGYWRGAVWAPPMMMIVDGLRDCGEHEFADDLCRRFCDNCARHGFAENFDGSSGEACCDPAYTWTASSFLIMAHSLMNSQE